MHYWCPFSFLSDVVIVDGIDLNSLAFYFHKKSEVTTHLFLIFGVCYHFESVSYIHLCLTYGHINLQYNHQDHF